MFRIKVAAALFLVFVAAGTVIYVNVGDSAETAARANTEQRLVSAQHALVRIRQLRDYAVVAKAQEVADWPQMAQILQRTPESFADAEGTPPDDEEYRYQVHRLMNVELAAWKAKFGAAASNDEGSHGLADYRTEVPDWFIVVDRAGVGVAKDKDPAWFGPAQANVIQSFPALAGATSEGKPVRDIWNVGGSLMVVAAIPVKNGDQVLGAVVLGYRLTDGEAKRSKALVDAEVAYFVGEELSQSSSLTTQHERLVKKLVASEKLYDPDRDPRKAMTVELSGQTYLAYSLTLTGYASAEGAGFVVLDNLDAALAKASEALWIIPVASALGFLLCLGMVLVFFQRFLAPFEEIDQGVMEILNGNLDYWFEIPGKEIPGTMSQNLNIMVCHLSGRPLPDEEEDGLVEGERWAESRIFVDEIDGSQFKEKPVDVAAVAAGEVGDLAPDVVRLVREDRETYQQRVFREYTEGLKQTGGALAGITFEKFIHGVTENAEALAQKYGCKQVRFLVEVDATEVRLKPIPMS